LQLTERPLTDFPFPPDTINVRPSSRLAMTIATAASSPEATAEEDNQERSSLTRTSTQERRSSVMRTSAQERSASVLRTSAQERSSSAMTQINPQERSFAAFRSTSNDPQSLIGISFKLPDNVMFLEKPEIAIWDKQSKHHRHHHIGVRDRVL